MNSHRQGSDVPVITAACVRRRDPASFPEDPSPVTKTGGCFDVRVINADGRGIPWNKVSRISQGGMKTLVTGEVNRFLTFLARTLFSPAGDKAFEKVLDRTTVPWVKNWDEPKHLRNLLMPAKGREG